MFMKKLMMVLLLVLSVSAFAGYTYTISEGMEFTDMTLKGTQSLLMTGGYGGNITLWDTTVMDYYGGEVEAVRMYDSAVLNMSGGAIDTGLYPSGHNVVNISAGYVKLLYVNGYTDATLTGGIIDSVTVGFNVSDVQITFVCDLDSLVYSYNSAGVLVGVLGNWLDGTEFNIEIQNRGYSPTSDYIKFIPEPASLFIVGLGGLWIWKKK